MLPDAQLSGLDDFLAALRFEGVPISPHQVVWLQHAFRLEPQLDRESLKDLLACTLVKHEAHHEPFESLFEAWCQPDDVQTGEQSESAEDDKARPPISSSSASSTPDFEPTDSKEPQDQPHTAHTTTYAWTSWRVWASILLLIGIVGISYQFIPQEREPSTENGAEKNGGGKNVDPGTPPPKPVSPKTDLPSDPAKEFWTWVPIPVQSIDPTWTALVLALLALLGGVFLWELYNNRKTVPKREALAPAGPQWLPLLEIEKTGPELLNRTALRSAVWGVERFVSEDKTDRLDIDDTVTATAAAGGLPSMRFEHAVYPREVWLWQDDMVQDPTVDRLITELSQRLTLAGLPVRVGTFVDTPTLVRWQNGQAGQEFSPLVLEGHRQSALVVILSDGYGMQLAAESALERNALTALLQSFTEWPRLTFVDVGDGTYNLARQVQGLQCLAPEDIPTFLGAVAAKPVAKRHAESDLFGDLRAWAAATALSPEPVTDESAFALRTRLGLSLSSWDFRDLLREAGNVGNRLSWSPARKVELLHWLVQCSTDKGTVIEDSPLDLALDYWLERYRTEDTQRDEHRSALLPWRHTPAEQRLRLETALLELWRQPEQAIPVLYQLSQALKDEVSERLQIFADWDNPERERQQAQKQQDKRVQQTTIYLPWKASTLSDQARWMLTALEFSSAPHPDDQPTKDLRPPVSMSLALGLSAGLAVAALSFVMKPLFVPAAPVSPLMLSHPFEVIQATPTSGEWKPVPNIQKFGKSELWRAGVLPQAVRGCEEGWPKQSFVVIQAEPSDIPARQLAVQLLDTGSADAVLLGTDWAEQVKGRIQVDEAMEQDAQLIVVAPPGAPVPEINFPGTFGVVRASLFATLAKRLDSFSGVKQLSQIWPKPKGDGDLVLRGGPTQTPDPKTGMTFAQVCGGTFTMGSSKEKDSSAGSDEIPAHPVTLSQFEISTTEVTNEQYAKFQKGHTGEANLPVTGVNWKEAKAFCQNYDYDLPTEAEWEYAARAGSVTRWSFGDEALLGGTLSISPRQYRIPEIVDLSRVQWTTYSSTDAKEKQLSDYAWFTENSDNHAHPVGTKLPNPLGLYDMYGNIWEWVEDCYDSETYQNRSHPVVDPLVNPGSDGNCQSGYRVRRGGSAWDEAGNLRSALRFRLEPEARFEYFGFRCVRRPRRQP